MRLSPLKDSYPWVALDGGMWSPDVLSVSSSVSREVFVFDGFWVVHPSLPLVPISLASQMESRSGRRSYERWCWVQ